MASNAENQVRDDASDKGEAVRGVGQLRSRPPRVTKLRNSVLFLVLVIACGLLGFILMKAKNRRRQQNEQTIVIKAGRGPATQQEKAVVDGMSRQGENVGSSHMPASFLPKSGSDHHSLLDEDNQNGNASMPPLQYTRNAGASGQPARALTPEEVQLQKEYELEQEALRSPMVVNTSAAQVPAATSALAPDPMQMANQALAKRLEQMANENPDAMGRVAGALLDRNNARGAPGLKPGLPVNASEYDSQNKQGDKENFGERVLAKKDADYQTETRIPALGPYEVKSGWLIPAVLDGELDSDLPGTVRAHVRENVYDSITGQYLLIPQGSKMVGEYNSHVGYGQKSLQAVFTRIIFPDGSSVNLESDPGVTNLGSAGLRDRVDEHWKRLMGGALLTSLFSAGIQVSQGQYSSILQSQSVGQQVGAAVGQELGQVGTEVTRRNLNIQPKLRIRPGYRFFASVARDVSFPAPYSSMQTVSEAK